MNRIVIGMMIATLVGCSSDDKDGGKCDGAKECEVPWDCDPGYTCDADTGCCVEFGCEPGTCEAGSFCDGDTGECVSVGQACQLAAQGCECHILNQAGELQASGDPPTITLPAGASYTLEAVLVVKGGGPLPGASFTYDVGDSSLFTVTGNKLQAAAGVGGSATLDASSGSYASCTAELEHLGTPPTDKVRVLVLNNATGAPIGGAVVVLDFGDSGETGPQDGLYVSTSSPTDPYTVTVFKEDYNYLSVVGIPASTTDLVLPLAARPSDPKIGGFTGKPDFTDYDKIVLGGRPKTIKVGMVSSSFSLTSLLNFDLELLIGPMPEGDCAEDVAGCYLVSIPPLIEPPRWVGLPGGVLLSLASNPIKSHFDVVGVPGRHYAWSLARELDITDVAGLIPLITNLIGDCDCDQNDGTCDADCSCDMDCLDYGEVLNNVIPLFSGFASGVKGNLVLEPVNMDAWQTYITPPYIDRTSSTSFPLLDTGGLGKLTIREPLEVFTDFTMGNLPPDPEYIDVDNRTMDAVVVLTGVNTRGMGFVPLGLAAGLDCTEGDCLKRDGSDGAGVFDGKINGSLVCLYDPDPEHNGCPPGVPTSALPDGHLGMFHGRAHGGLQGQKWLTVAVALPIASLVEDSSTLRVAAKVVRAEPFAGSSNQLSGTGFPTFPARADLQAGHQLAISQTSGTGVHWVTVAADDTDGTTVRWNIYYPSEGGDFAAPNPATYISGAVDPFTPDKINATHIGFSTSTSLAELVANNGSTLGDLLDTVDGFTVTSGDVDVTP